MAKNAESMLLSAQTGTTDASGNVTFNYTIFDAPPIVSLALGPSGDAALIEARIVSLTATQCVVNVRRSTAITVLGIQVLAAMTPANGATVQFWAVEAGDYI